MRKSYTEGGLEDNHIPQQMLSYDLKGRQVNAGLEKTECVLKRAIRGIND